jgi:acyl-ACP thioesterase
VPKLKTPIHRIARTPSFSHLDMNGHVNNVHFAAWALEALPWEFRRTHRLTLLDIVFRNEIRQEDTITAACAPDTDDQFVWLHSLVRSDDSTEIARLRTQWE